MNFDINIFLNNILFHSNLNQAIDYALTQINELLENKEYIEIEKIFETEDIFKYHPTILIGILIVTEPFRKELPKRIMFYNKVKNIVKKKYRKKLQVELLNDIIF